MKTTKSRIYIGRLTKQEMDICTEKVDCPDILQGLNNSDLNIN